MKYIYVCEKFTAALFLLSPFFENHWKICHEPTRTRDRRFEGYHYRTSTSASELSVGGFSGSHASVQMLQDLGHRS